MCLINMDSCSKNRNANERDNISEFFSEMEDYLSGVVNNKSEKYNFDFASNFFPETEIRWETPQRRVLEIDPTKIKIRSLRRMLEELPQCE